MPSTSSSAHPAIKSYFFGKGYRDFLDTIKDAFAKNRLAASEYWDGGKARLDGFLSIAVAAFWFGRAASVWTFGTLSIVFLVVIHGLVLGIFFALIYVAFTVVAGFERLLMLIRRFVSVCPYCHSQLPLPVYLCDHCGQAHPRLIPSAFGVFFHRCQCGAKLPCTVFTNRGRLQSQCPNCGGMLQREHTETRKQFVPIVGGPAVGKSAYLIALIRSLRETTAPGLGMTASLVSQTQEDAYHQVVGELDVGQQPDKTTETIPPAFDLLLQGAGHPDLTLYLYDAAGEAFLC
jgi:hypothetical protein